MTVGLTKRISAPGYGIGPFTVDNSLSTLTVGSMPWPWSGAGIGSAGLRSLLLARATLSG